MDPFEGRLQYLDLLRRLGASTTNQQRTAAFALKNRDLDEDLHSCVLEELDGQGYNSRVNLLFFLATLCECERRVLSNTDPASGSSGGGASDGDATYLAMVLRDLDMIIATVAPKDDVQGKANVQQVRQWLLDMESRGFLSTRRRSEVEASLGSPDRPQGGSATAEVETNKRKHTRPMTREEILRRIEDDRERHKRLRESLWMVPTSGRLQQAPQPQVLVGQQRDVSTPATPFVPSTGQTSTRSDSTHVSAAETYANDYEFDQAWETTSSLDEHDFEEMLVQERLCERSRAVRV